MKAKKKSKPSKSASADPRELTNEEIALIRKPLSGTRLKLTDDRIWPYVAHVRSEVNQRRILLSNIAPLSARKTIIRRLEALDKAISGLNEYVKVLAEALSWVRYDKRTEGLPIEQRAEVIDAPSGAKEAEDIGTFFSELRAACKLGIGFCKRGKRGKGTEAELRRAFVCAAAFPFALAGGKVLSENEDSLFARWLESLDDALGLNLLTRELGEYGTLKTSPSNSVRHAIRSAFGADEQKRKKAFSEIRLSAQHACPWAFEDRQKK